VSLLDAKAIVRELEGAIAASRDVRLMKAASAFMGAIDQAVEFQRGQLRAAQAECEQLRAVAAAASLVAMYELDRSLLVEVSRGIPVEALRALRIEVEALDELRKLAGDKP
jgi:hypothetical protein